jgi:3'(2'), 5'-bisphosphate nucleotidase
MEQFHEYRQEIEIVSDAIFQVCNVALKALKKLDRNDIMTKSDGSAVTVFDYVGQAIICNSILKSFPDDQILGEENLSSISDSFLQKMKTIINNEFDPIEAFSKCVLQLPRTRCWAVDPIDGTSSFIEKKDFAVGISLLVERETKLSFVGWPLHKPELSGIQSEEPVIFVAIEKRGIFGITMDKQVYKIEKQQEPYSRIVWTGSTKSNLQFRTSIQNSLEIKESFIMPSMVKGIMIGCGTATVFIRLFSKEFVWDISPIELFIRESGGFVTTSTGQPISYSRDGYVEMDSYLIFSSKDLEFHQKIVDSLKKY